MSSPKRKPRAKKVEDEELPRLPIPQLPPDKPPYKTGPISPEQEMKVRKLLSGRVANLAAMTGLFQGAEVVYIIAYINTKDEAGKDIVCSKPVAILVDDPSFMARFGDDIRDCFGHSQLPDEDEKTAKPASTKDHLH